MSVVTPQASVQRPTWGVPTRPFAANSPWNARPVQPVLSNVGVPTGVYVPSIEAGAYATGVYVASSTDAPVQIRGLANTPGVWDPDAREHAVTLTLPRWPASALPASGTDGHCEVIDPVTGVVHSFWQLRNDHGVWRAAQHAWSKLDGRGWGDPAHTYQGARAAGVPTLGGLIRTHEVNDGETLYRHALAMSLAKEGLAANPAYVFPATSADADAQQVNTGQVPEGALMMLPSTFNTAVINDPGVRKVAETLKVHGAYVVDRNVGTPFVIYAETGSDASPHRGSWNSTAAADLEVVRGALRMVSSVSGWRDGNGAPTTLVEDWNLLSLRGPWNLEVGAPGGAYRSLSQRVEFNTPTATPVVMSNANGTGHNQLGWGRVSAGQRLQLTARAQGGAKLRLQAAHCTDASKSVDTGNLADGQVANFTWPASVCWMKLTATSGINQVSSVGSELRAVP